MLNESTPYLMIEVISDTVENNERVIHRRKTCIGNPVEHFVTEEVVRVPVTEPKKEEVKVSVKPIKTKKVRARNAKGHYVADNPDTPENEAWVTKVVKKVKSVRKPRKKKND
tara:strand:- start:236 stop:571 length:336 start_codon:yes stop_codon:yes gene_type:complete